MMCDSYIPFLFFQSIRYLLSFMFPSSSPLVFLETWGQCVIAALPSGRKVSVASSSFLLVLSLQDPADYLFAVKSQPAALP
jgi:hypothetical protein